MKIAFTNFLTTLKCYKTASILNIAGLTIAFIAFYIIMAQVHYEFTYNRSIPVEMRTVRHNFFQFFGIPVNFGRDFTQDDSGNKNLTIYNKVAHDLYQKREVFYKKANIYRATREQMIGVLDDKMLVTPLNEEQKTIIYKCADPFDLITFYIRLHPTVDVAQFSEFVR